MKLLNENSTDPDFKGKIPDGVSKVLGSTMEFQVAIKSYLKEGDLVYEYNPFRNYRVLETMFKYKGTLYYPKELLQELGFETIELETASETEAETTVINIESATTEECLSFIKLKNSWEALNVPSNETDPELIEAGQLTDFETSELNFDLKHPVSIIPLYSYDNSVNLIINDGKNKPRLINSRFSATERNKYLIVDRKGNNDTNIYDLGDLFDLDTSLYRLTVEIPTVLFLGVNNGGIVPIGNYHFYFKYADADGNETDFVAESGLVSVFIGTTPQSIYTGFRNESSNKLVLLRLSNIDPAYLYVNVYYTRSTSDIYENATTNAYKINLQYIVTNLLTCDIIFTGYESMSEISIDEINTLYLLADSIETLAACLNMLFIGNIQKSNIPYNDLADLSLRFIPRAYTEDYPLTINHDYTIASLSMGYYDPKFIYSKVGYWNHEIYRFGIVYILSNGSLSPVFNTLGINELPAADNPNFYYNFYYNVFDEDGLRLYLTVEEDNYRVVLVSSSVTLCNSKGVCILNISTEALKPLIYSINFWTSLEVLNELRSLGIKGFFFVRQKRIPTTLCQAYTIGIDSLSNTPILPIENGKYITERFLDDNLILKYEYLDRLYTQSTNIRKEAAICPEYDVDSPYLNTIFSGGELSVIESDWQPLNDYLSNDGRNYYISMENGKSASNSREIPVNILGVEDNVKLVAIKNLMFSARAGEAEEAFRYEYLEKENKVTSASNLVRGSYGPYLGITGFPDSGKLIDIKIPGYYGASDEDLFKIRYEDKTAFFAISDRFDINKINNWMVSETLEKPSSSKEENNEETQTASIDGYTLLNNLYRGDCYICLFSHRLNRNFLDPSSPTNDKIVDEKCWADNYEVADSVVNIEKFDDINLGDVNAIKLGLWVTIPIRSTKNLNIRSIDDSIPDEAALFGSPRGFYPRISMTASGSLKIPEALCYNKGFEKSVSERYNFELPDVPAIKNEFSNRIAYSDICINDAFKNGFRVFLGTHYRDYPKTYGSVTKIIELRGNLICVFEHGVALIPVNERAVAGEGSGGNVYINTSNVLPENPKVLSDIYGSLWRESIIKTPRAIYGVDTIGKKIWRTNGTEFECISDFKVQRFLHDNISLTERETDPIIGIRNVKTHFNRFKNDVMFTFYDNLYGFEERVWNLCFNEDLQKWTTFYSWVPSYSENIYNLYFSFDRNTSKWIAKLGVSKYGNDFSDGVTLENNIIYWKGVGDIWWTKLHLSNRTIPVGDEIKYKVSYELVRDNYLNYKNFKIYNTEDEYFLTFADGDASKIYESLKSELYSRDSDGSILKDDKGRRIWLPKDLLKNPDKIVILLNIRAHITIEQDQLSTLEEAYSTGFTNKLFIDGGYYESVVAVIPEYNLLFLTTDFWKHGRAGIIDIADKIYPTYWYGKQHPFEFEFVVADNPDKHKIFDNLLIISNNAEPESFHYEIVGDVYDFAKDKKNMYIRLEATKELYLYNGSDISYDNDYSQLESIHRPLLDINDKEIEGKYDKSTIMPLYYSRQDTINEIENYYHLKDGNPTKDFSALSGGEIVKYDNPDEYRVWSHAKAVDVLKHGRLRGNMLYNEDKWLVLINPINVVYKNEEEWNQGDIILGRTTSPDKVPIELGLSPIPDEVLLKGDITYDPDDPVENDIPENSMDRSIVSWNWKETLMQEVKLKDKWIKIRIRYTGNKLAIINAVYTMYSISYS